LISGNDLCYEKEYQIFFLSLLEQDDRSKRMKHEVLQKNNTSVIRENIMKSIYVFCSD